MVFAEALIKSLHSLGVKYIFGIPGGPSIPYLKAMSNHGVKFILVSNEQSAAIMADVCGRLTGIPGVCHGTFGPGATNLSSGVGGAFLDRSPLIAFTTEVRDEDLGRTVQMNINHQLLYKPLAKWTTRLSRNIFKKTLTKAFKIATSERPGPVHIGLPSDIGEEILNDSNFISSVKKETIPLPPPLLLAEAEKSMKKSKRPVLAVGLTALRLGVHQLIRNLVDKNNIPVILTPMAKGIIPENHPYYAGVLFHARNDLVARIYRKADLIIGLGYDPVEVNYESWMPHVPLLHIDTKPADITGEYSVVCNVTGDLAYTLTYLNSLTFPAYDWDPVEIQDNKERLFQAFLTPANTFTPAQLLLVLREVLPDDGMITCDVGAHLHLMGQFWQVNDPNHFIITNGWSTMGFGLPAALGVKLCRPEKPVVCVTGDGGFLMNCGEIITARRLGLNIVIIVLCDHNLSLIRVKQLGKKIIPYGTDLYEGRYFGADKFFDVPVFQAHDKDEMKASLFKAFSATGPVIIEAIVDGSQYQQVIRV